jgi:wobble nucleotide-excising tRNase
LTATGSVTFKSEAWSRAMPQLSIFDSTFVADNVFSGDAVDLDHKRNLYRVIIGHAGIALAQKVNELDAKIRTQTSTIKNKRAMIEGRVPSGFGFDTFVSPAHDPDIDTKITEKRRELEAVEQSNRLRARAGLSQIALSELPAGIGDLLQRTVAGLSANVEQQIATHIAKHKMQETGEAWLQKGLAFVQGDSCPFCDQPLEGVSAVPLLSVFFSEAYEQLKAEIAAAREQFATLFSDRVIGDAERTIEANTAGAEFWARYCDLKVPMLSSPEGFAPSFRELRDAAIALLDKKAATPLEDVQIDQRFNDAMNVVRALRASIAEYNRAAANAQIVVAAKKKSLEGANATQARSDRLRLQAIKARGLPETIKACREYSAAQKQKGQFETEKEDARRELDKYTQGIVNTYERTINQYLRDFQTGFRITGTTHSYPGGVPSSTFQILINDVAVNLGDGKTALNEPSFRNTLSAGDKSTLALAFFLAQLHHDPDKAGRVVVFDDPFNSQDSFRKEHTVQEIRRCGEASSQVIVLSHDRAFLRRMHDHLIQRTMEAKCLQLARMGERETRILPWDIEEATQTKYQSGLTALAEFYNLSNGIPADVSAKMRLVLETYCRMIYPSTFNKDDELGTICEKIRDAGPNHELARFCNDIDSINEYSRDHHHGDKPGVPQSYIDETELQGFVEKTLMIVGYC